MTQSLLHIRARIEQVQGSLPIRKPFFEHCVRTFPYTIVYHLLNSPNIKLVGSKTPNFFSPARALISTGVLFTFTKMAEKRG